jgi:hypothetical protein
MKGLVVLSLALTCANAFAGRSGTDERIHMCTVKDGQKYIGTGKIRVHVKAGEFIKVTRMSDKKYVEMEPGRDDAYVIAKDGKGGDLWPAKTEAYMYDVDAKDGSFTIAYGISDSTYDNIQLSCELVKTISKLDKETPSEKRLNEIVGEVEYGNGGWEVSKYDTDKFSLSAERSALLKRRFKGCKWDLAEGKKDAFKSVNAIYEGSKVVDILKKIDKDPGIKEILALVSDSDVSCSRAYIRVFTADGYKVEMNVDGSD